MKKFLSFLLVAVLVVTAFSPAVFAANGDNHVDVTTKTAAPGELVKLPVHVTGEFTSFELSLYVVDGLEIVGFEGVVGNVKNGKVAQSFAFAQNEYTFNVLIQVADDIQPGTYDVTTVVKLVALNQDKLSFTSNNGAIIIPEPETEPTEPSVPETEPTEPSVPGTEPSEPSVPGTEPSNPTEPSVPGTEPTNPTEPSVPGTEPTNPTEPSVPGTEPSEPTEPTETEHVHAWGPWELTKEPTCTEAGEETRKCACGETETRPVAALGHDWVTVWTQTKTHHWHACTRCDATCEHYGEHEGTWQTVKHPTKTEKGLQVKICKICEYEMDRREIDPTPDDEPTPGKFDFALVNGAITGMMVLSAAAYVVLKRKAVK